jgi:hypothetical protein
MALTHVVLDFDGTCTLVEATQADFLTEYRRLLGAHVTDLHGAPIGRDFAARWDEALAAVRAASPEAGWATLSRVASAPAHADPYIAAGEAVAWLERRWLEANPGQGIKVPATLYKDAYDRFPAPWRPEISAVLQQLVDLDVEVAFVSNSSEATIGGRLDTLLADVPELRAKITVVGGASKFIVKELDWDGAISRAASKPFRKLAAAQRHDALDRPIYLRRGGYYQALLRVWGQAGPSPRSTLIVGDIYELDLAMPAALGAHVHLVERAEPFSTCKYEVALTRKAGGKVSPDLEKLPARAAKLRKRSR